MKGEIKMDNGTSDITEEKQNKAVVQNG